MEKLYIKNYITIFFFAFIIMISMFNMPIGVEAAPCVQGEFSSNGTCTAISDAKALASEHAWATAFKEYLVEIALVLALSVKSIALITVIYCGIQYMSIMTDVKSMEAVKKKLIGAFVALFVAASSELIINIVTEVVKAT